MTDQERLDFIESIAPIIQKIGPEYGIKVSSPIIAQACLESTYGTSDKAQYHNYFGLKYRPDRVDCSSGIFESKSEEEENGERVPITTDWFMFDSMEDGIRGYFQFLNSVSNYDNLKGVTDPREYLENIKADHYATASDYVDNNMRVIEENNLTRFDGSNDNKEEKQEEIKMSNSSLVTQTLLSPNCNSPRNKAISKITIHHTAGFASVDEYLRSFAREERQASANYVVKDNQVGLCVEECNRAWTSSSPSNDNMAVTIEVGNDGGPESDWHVSDESLETVIALCVDICKRNGIEALNFTGDASGNLTMHRYFAATNCPGPYLGSKFPYIADRVNAALRDEDYVPSVPEHNDESGDKSIDELVAEVIRGEWGNGEDRRAALTAAGYNYAEVQAAVDAYYSTPDEESVPLPPTGNDTDKKTIDEVVAAVLRGEYGNGEERRAKLEDEGYSYEVIQNAVNEAINGPQDTGDAQPEDPNKMTLAEVAYAVIRGDYGNGDERREKLEAEGYDYDAVQAKVDALLNGESDEEDEAPAEEPADEPEESEDLTDDVAYAVLRGDYGNGDERREKLEAEGYDYDAIQSIVNYLANGADTVPDAKPTVSSELVDAVIRGDYGNGDERREKLEAEGYDFDEVQAAVNARY